MLYLNHTGEDARYAVLPPARQPWQRAYKARLKRASLINQDRAYDQSITFRFYPAAFFCH